MKKIMMMIAMLAIPFAMQAQTKFHDVEANEAKGAVKTMTMDMMGMSQSIEFSEAGKMVNSSLMSDAVYDENGYLTSVKMSFQGQSTTVKITWENGRMKSRSLNVMGNDVINTYNYDENGVVTSESINMGGQLFEIPYSDYKFDDHGNWISRKAKMMGQEMTTTRTFTYY